MGGLKGNSILREIVNISTALAMLECCGAIAFSVSIGRLNTEQSEQHWFGLLASALAGSKLIVTELSVC